MPHVRLVGLRLHADLLHRFDRRHDGRAVDEVGDRHPFEQVAVAAPRPAAQRQVGRVRLVLIAHELRVARLDDARRRDRRVEGVAPEDRQRLQRILVQRRGHRCARPLDHRRRAGHRHLLAQLADLQREVLHNRLLRADPQTRPFLALEPGEADPETVDARQHAREHVLADVVRHRGARGVGLFIRQRHLHAGDHTLGIADKAAQSTLVSLSCRRQCRNGHQHGQPRQQGRVPQP